jgi:hypothetical protein
MAHFFFPVSSSCVPLMFQLEYFRVQNSEGRHEPWPERASSTVAGQLPKLKLTVTSISTATGVPFNNVGWYFH